MEGLAGNIHRVAVTVDGPGQVEAGACVRVVVVVAVGVVGAVLHNVNVAELGTAGVGAEIIRADHTPDTGNQDARQGDGVAVLQSLVQEVDTGQRPAEGAVGNTGIGVAVVVGPVSAGTVLGVGDGVVPDGVGVVLRASQGVPGAAILGDPDLTGFHRAQAGAGGGVLEGVAVDVEVNAVLVGGIVRQAVFKVVGGVAAEVTQGLEGAAQRALAAEAVADVGILAVDAQIVNQLVGTVCHTLGGGEGIGLSQAVQGHVDLLLGGSQLYGVIAILVGSQSLSAQLDRAALANGEGQGGIFGRIGGNGELVRESLRIEGRVPVASGGGGGGDSGLLHLGQLLDPEGVGGAHLSVLDAVNGDVAGFAGNQQLFLAGGHLRVGVACGEVSVITDDLDGELDLGVLAFLSDFGEGDCVGLSAALGQFLPGGAVIDGVTDVGVNGLTLEQSREVRTTVLHEGTVVVLGIGPGVGAVLHTGLAGLEQIAFGLIQVQSGGQSTAVGGVQCHFGAAPAVRTKGLGGVTDTGDFQGVNRLDLRISLVTQSQCDHGDTEGHIRQLGLGSGRNGNADSLAGLVGVSRDAVQLLVIEERVALDGQNLSAVIAQLDAGVILLIDIVLEGGGGDAKQSQGLKGGILGIGDDHLDAALGALVIGGGDDDTAHGVGGDDTVLVHGGDGLVGTAPGGHGAAALGVGLELGGGGLIIGGQLQIDLTLTALVVFNGHAGDVDGGGIGELLHALGADVHGELDIHRARPQDIHFQRAGGSVRLGDELHDTVGSLDFPAVVVGHAADDGDLLYGLAVSAQRNVLVLIVVGDGVKLNVNDHSAAGHIGIQSGDSGHIGVAGGIDGVDTGFGIKLAAISTLILPDDGSFLTVFVHSFQPHGGTLLDNVGHTAVGIGAGVGNRIGIVRSQGKALGHRLDGDFHNLAGGGFQTGAGSHGVIVEGAQGIAGDGQGSFGSTGHGLAALGGGGGVHIPLIADGGGVGHILGVAGFHSQGVLGVLSDGQSFFGQVGLPQQSLALLHGDGDGIGLVKAALGGRGQGQNAGFRTGNQLVKAHPFAVLLRSEGLGDAVEIEARGAVVDVLHFDPQTPGCFFFHEVQRLHGVVHGVVDKCGIQGQLPDGVLGAADAQVNLDQIGFLQDIAHLEHVQGGHRLIHAGDDEADLLVGHVLGDMKGNLAVLVGDLAGDRVNLAGLHIHGGQLRALNDLNGVAVGGVVALDDQVKIGVRVEGLAGQGLSVGGFQPDVLVQVIGGILAHAEGDVVAVCYLGLVDEQTLAILTGGLLAIDQDGQIEGFLAHALSDPVGITDGQEVRSVLGGELIEEDQLVGMDQHVQRGHAVLNQIPVAVALGQVAGNLLIEGENLLIARFLIAEGHGGIGHGSAGDGDHTVGSGQGRGDGNDLIALAAGPVGNLGLNLTLGGDDVGAGLVQGQGHVAVFVGNGTVNGGELTVFPDAHLGTGQIAGVVAAHGHGGAALKIQGEGLTGLGGDGGLGEVADRVRPVFLIGKDTAVQLVTLSHGTGLVGHALRQSHVVLQEIVAALRGGGYVPQLLNKALNDFITTGAVGLMQSHQSLIIGQNAVAVPIGDGNGQLNGGLAVGGGGQNALVAHGEGDLGVSRGLHGAALDGDYAVRCGDGAVNIIGVEAVIRLAGQGAAGGDDVGTGLGEAQLHGAVGSGLRTGDGLEAALFPGAYGNARSILSTVIAAAEAFAGSLQGQGEFLALFDGDLGLVEVAQAVGIINRVLDGSGVQLVALGNGAGAVVDSLVQNLVVLGDDGSGDFTAPEFFHGVAIQGVAIRAILLVQGNQCLIKGQNAVGVDIRYGNGQLHRCLSVGGLCQHALLADGEGNRHRVGGFRHYVQSFLGLLGGSLGLGSLRSGSLGFRGLRRGLGFGGLRLGSLRYRRLCLGCFRLKDRSLRLLHRCRYGFLRRFVREDAGGDHADQHHEGQQQCQYPSFHRILPFRRAPQGMSGNLSPGLSPLTTKQKR